MVEYVLLVALIAVLAVAGMKVLGHQISERFSGVASRVDAEKSTPF